MLRYLAVYYFRILVCALAAVLASCGGKVTQDSANQSANAGGDEAPSLAGDHWLADCNDGCPWIARLNITESFPERWGNDHDRIVEHRTNFSYHSGYLYFTLLDPPALVRLSEGTRDIEVLVETEHDIGPFTVTDSGVFWYRYISGGVTPEGVAPIEAELRGYSFESETEAVLFDTSAMSSRPVIDNGRVYAMDPMMDADLLTHDVNGGDWELASSLDEADRWIALDTVHDGRFLWASLQNNRWNLHFELLTARGRSSVALEPRSLTAPNPPNFAGSSDEHVFLEQGQHLEGDEFVNSLFAVKSTGEEPIHSVLTGDSLSRYGRAAIVGEDMLLMFTGSSARSLGVLPDWIAQESASLDDVTTLEDDIVEFYVGNEFLVVVAGEGDVLWRELP